jgi:hypothetical protein
VQIKTVKRGKGFLKNVLEKYGLILAGTKQKFGFSVLGMSLYTGQNRDTFKLLNKVNIS